MDDIAIMDPERADMLEPVIIKHALRHHVGIDFHSNVVMEMVGVGSPGTREHGSPGTRKPGDGNTGIYSRHQDCREFGLVN